MNSTSTTNLVTCVSNITEVAANLAKRWAMSTRMMVGSASHRNTQLQHKRQMFSSSAGIVLIINQQLGTAFSLRLSEVPSILSRLS